MVSKQKVSMLEKLNQILKSYKTILLFDLHTLPSRQLHYIRAKLKEEGVSTIVPKKKILAISLKNNNIPLDIKDINQPALIYSNEDIFNIEKKLRKLKVNRKAKASEIATSDIEIPAGDTDIQAGPAISIFKQFKIQTIMKNGKIGIREPTIVCKKGETITTELLSLLNMLNIEPIEMSIHPVLGYSENIVYNKEILELDEQYFKEQISIAADNLFKLTFFLGYPTKQNISLLLQKGFQNARFLGRELGLPIKEILPELITLAEQRATKLESLVKK